MVQTFLLFDFGSDEDLAQQARLTLERWKQGFRLGKKLSLKFDRHEPAEADGQQRSKDAAEEKQGSAESRITLIVGLDFSEHERLSHQRWLERIPAEIPFKDAHPKVIRRGDADFAPTAERFDDLD